MTQAKKKRKLLEKIHDCARRRDFLGEVKYCKELALIEKEERDREKHTIFDCISDRTVEERREVTTRLIYAIALGDMLNNAVMEVEKYFRVNFGIGHTPMLVRLRNLSRQLQEIVKTIDDVGSGVFSERYMDVVDEIEMKFDASLRTYALNRLLKAARQVEQIKSPSIK